MEYFIGIDVGTNSARVGLFDVGGSLISHAIRDIQIWKPKANFVEQSSKDIWQSICYCCHDILEESKVHPDKIKGIGFDATCSLVLLDSDERPVTVDPNGDPERNIIVWMDHRAINETEFINQYSREFSLFRYLGGKISPEMQIPKLLWLKKNLPKSFKKASDFFDLPDYLSFRATGSKTRSLCSLTCKWTYQKDFEDSKVKGWDLEFFEKIGLEDFPDEGFCSIGNSVKPMGSRIGNGLTEESAKELGLNVGTPVGVSIIDAHAGGLGMIGLKEGMDSVDYNRRIALIGGTSSCHMAVSNKERFIKGVWGPYNSAMVPSMWLNEGGQSATGSLLDHSIRSHGAYAEALEDATSRKQSIYTFLNKRLEEISIASNCQIDFLTKSLHVCPYFLGNRSPRANPSLRGMVSGLKLSASIDDLSMLYLATIQAIAYGTRHIIEAMNEKGYTIDTLICCGGGTKNSLFLQQHANITACRLILPKEMESVLLGSAMIGSVASGIYPNLKKAMESMSHFGSAIEASKVTAKYHNRKYKIFHQLYKNQIEYKAIMES